MNHKNPMDPKNIHEMDQYLKLFTDTVPSLLFSVYSSFLREGFNEAMAYGLTVEYFRNVLSTRPK